jgi:hypothetical protein
MSGSKFTVSRGVVCERVGDELMIVVPGHAEVVKLKGEAADVFLDVQAGRTPHASGNLTSELEALGIIEASGMSRRGLIKAGAIGAGAGIAVLAMPSVAAASSDSVVDLEGYWDENSWIFNGVRQNDTVFFVIRGKRINSERYPFGVFTEATLPSLAVENSSGDVRDPDVRVFAVRTFVPNGYDELEWRGETNAFDLERHAPGGDPRPERFGTFSDATGTTYRVRFVFRDNYDFSFDNS